jgi:hypothetical protein
MCELNSLATWLCCLLHFHGGAPGSMYIFPSLLRSSPWPSLRGFVLGTVHGADLPSPVVLPALCYLTPQEQK